jgi:heme-degrading monooxygenase HmoA
VRIYYLEIQISNFRRKIFFMIARIWHGWTNLQNANAYEQLLKHEIFENISNKNIEGYKGIELLKKINNNEAEFITIMYFENLDAIKEFAGEKYETAVVPENARRLLLRYDHTSQHYEILKEKES